MAGVGLYGAGVAALLLGLGACQAREEAGAGAKLPTESELERQLGAAVDAHLDTTSAARLSGSFRSAAARALTSVVQIEVLSRGTLQIPPGAFHDFLVPEQGGEQIIPASGSGFLIDSEGHILTNHHVVENAVDIKVRLVDGRELDAQLVGSDPNSDVAVIKVQADTALPASRLADSEELKVGDWVLALGSPLGLRFSVTAGIVSAMNRNINILRTEAPLEAFIQTDAAINPGNSGGPLVDLAGRVVGINSAIQTQTGYFSGAGFAIPINLARKFAADLIEYGTVHRPRLGIVIEDVSAADAEVYRLPVVGGVEVRGVTAGESADRAGVKLGDVIFAMNGRPVDAVAELQARVAQLKPGETVQLELVRYGKALRVPVRLGEFEPEARRRQARAAAVGNRLGFTVVPLPRQYAARVGLPGRSDVPVVNAVDPFSPAAEARLLVRHAILSLNGRPVTVAELRRQANRFRSGDVVSLIVVNPVERPRPTPLMVNFRIP